MSNTIKIDADWVASLPGNSVTARLEEARKHLRQYDFKPKRPLLSREPGSDEARKYADLMDQWERDLEAWNKAVESLKKHNSMIESAMGEYVKREGGLDQVPEQYRAKVWAKSYEDGHSGGWSEVYCQLQGLVEIFVS